MKAFLSHSSKDKGFVEAVSSLLRPGTFELDSLTFDKGLLNSQSIIASLKRCDLFCLFLSSDSVVAPYVDFETLLGIEFLASGKVGRFLAICLDGEAFAKASANVRFFNIVRRGLEPENAALLIQGYLISAAEKTTAYSHPFIGREEELVELERQISDLKRPPSRALYISGNFGAGRRTIAQKFYEHQFPNVGRSFPTISLDPFAGLEELYRRILATLRPTVTASELLMRVQSFAIASIEEKRRLVAQLINSLLAANEATFLMDKGGVLTDTGGFTAEFNEVISHLEARPHPPAIIISPRMVPMKFRRSENDVSYLAVKSLRRESAARIIGRLLKDRGLSVTDEEMSQLIKLSDCHPFNIYQMIDEIAERGVAAFLADPRDFIDWKHRQSSEYLTKIEFGERDASMLGLLKQLPELDFAAIVDALELEAATASEDLLRLTHLHIIESSGDAFSIAPALQVAVERDRRFRLNKDAQQSAMKKLAKSLAIRLEEGTAPIILIDAAVLSSLDSGDVSSSFAAAFLLPSHHVWIAKRQYDQRHWHESIRYSAEALKGSDRLSSEGFVAACRYQCLSAARLGEQQIFDDGITKLIAAAKSDWAKSNIAFLNGINQRFKGSLPQAENFFRESYALSPGNLHAARELAEICLARDNLDEAEFFAREAHSHGPTNPYLLDTLISVLVRKHGRSAKHVSEINDLFDTLESVGDQGGRSFFTTRKAEFEYLWGSNKEAARLVEDAIAKTPTIFEPRRLHALIMLKDGNKTKAFETIRAMHEMVNARNPDERRSNFRAYLETNAAYLVETSRYKEAKEIYDDPLMFTDNERTKAVRDIEIAEGFATERAKTT
jgi:tetratricopeptide (TPR) repeat protein